MITRKARGYRNHPETNRWRGALRALFRRHEQQVREMSSRGYIHRSPLAAHLATGRAKARSILDTRGRQRLILRRKGCSCRV